jgi:nucleotide-binding universal stress UspA family protein
MRSILLHAENDASLDSRVQAALSLARATNGHVTCLHVTPLEAYMTFDSFGGVFVLESVIEALAVQESTLKARVEDQFRNEDVSWEYQKSTGSIPHTIMSYAALADVVVTGRSEQDGKRVPSATGRLGNLLVESRTPLLIPGLDGPSFDPLGKAMIAWNGCYEAANAVRGALGLLQLAESVEVVRVEEEDSPSFPSTRLLEYLSRHDVHAELRVEPMEREYVAAAIVACAEESGTSHIVLGGYGHSRIGEYVYGGVTRSLLTSSPINLVMAH